MKQLPVFAPRQTARNARFAHYSRDRRSPSDAYVPPICQEHTRPSLILRALLAHLPPTLDEDLLATRTLVRLARPELSDETRLQETPGYMIVEKKKEIEGQLHGGID